MRRFVVLACALALLTVCLPQHAAAQREGQISIGYSSLSNKLLAVNASNLPWGFFFDSSFELNDTVSIAFDLNGHFRRGIQPSDSREYVVPPLPTEDFQVFSFNRPESEWCSPAFAAYNEQQGSEVVPCHVGIQTVGAVVGPRFHVQAGNVRPFVHFMAGWARALRKIDFFSHTATHFAIQPGGGIDIDMNEATAFRIQVDLRTTMYPTPDQRNPRSSLVSRDGEDHRDLSMSFGVVFKLGG